MIVCYGAPELHTGMPGSCTKFFGDEPGIIIFTGRLRNPERDSGNKLDHS
jgi:hypothetical protein